MSSSRRELSDAYRHLYTEVTEILARHDFVGLLFDDTPEDEYTPESARIIARLNEAASPRELAAIMRRVFTEMFDVETAGCEDRYTDAALEIWVASITHGFKKEITCDDSGSAD